MKLTIQRWDNGAMIYEAEAASIGEVLAAAVADHVNLYRARLVGASLDGASLVGASLDGASLVGASLVGARLVGARLDADTVIETGETWGQYLREVVPALLTAGGRMLADILQPLHWDCHDWNNCPMAAAFAVHKSDNVPILYRPRSEQFIRYFDAKLIDLEMVGKGPLVETKP